jgi:hypothetical protein
MKQKYWRHNMSVTKLKNLPLITHADTSDHVVVVHSGKAAIITVDDFGIAEKHRLTPEGGFAVRLTNKTGAVSVKGTVVTADTSADNAVKKIAVDVPAPIGVIYDDDIADGAEVWVVLSGIAAVYFTGTTVRGHFARGFIAADIGYVSGQALSEAVPSSPFATDKHFYEIGHVLESRTGAGLANCILHFN